jgi:hypothetical protein
MRMSEDFLIKNWKVPPEHRPRKWPEPSPQIMRQLNEDRVEVNEDRVEAAAPPEPAIVELEKEPEPVTMKEVAVNNQTEPTPPAPAPERRPRRRWSEAEKARIVAETFEPGATVARQ